jgi:hypothetical protein
VLLVIGIVLMIIDPYEEYSLALLIAGGIMTLVWIGVMLGDRREKKAPSTHPSSYIQSSYQPSSFETETYQPVTETQDIYSTPASPDKRFCSHCGAETESGKNFCENCGQKI